MKLLATISLSVIVAVLLFAAAACTGDAPSDEAAVAVDDDDIGGIVSGPRGPEAGAWVIAETSDLPTSYIKIVVTDDDGRYVVPDLPDAQYDIWVRGYGLVDSPKQQARPGQTMDLEAFEAPSPAVAAEIYPSGHWFSLIEVPDTSEFPGTGPSGNGIS